MDPFLMHALFLAESLKGPNLVTNRNFTYISRCSDNTSAILPYDNWLGQNIS